MIKTQVLIIGAGPVGMLSAISLAQAGVQCVLLDKRLNRQDAPKAHAVNARTLEICERLGVSADEISASGASIADAGLVHFVDTLTGVCFGSLPYERQDEAVKAYTPWPLVNIPQPKFEGFLNEALGRLEGASLLRGLSVQTIEQDSEGVSTLVSGAGCHEPISIRSDYVIAADGANSAVRGLLDIGLTGPEGLANNMMIHFEADLTKLTQQHPGLLYFCLSPEASGAFIGYERDKTWVFMQAYDPASQTREDFDDETCQKFIEAAVGMPLPQCKIKNVSPWTMSAQVADNYSKGRVYLVGDAAHRFPPTGGLGLNTGVADAQNLTWKMAQVIHGEASVKLLDTYELERKPVAEVNTEQSLMNSAKIFQVFEAVYGSDPGKIAEHYSKACANPDQQQIKEAVEIQRPHFDSLALQLGYRYGAAVDPDMNISCYTPAFEVGDFLPLIELQEHPWLLGLLPTDRFTLVTGPEGTPWQYDGVTTFIESQDFCPKQAFWTRAGIEKDGALLIRPDGHIAARWNRLADCLAVNPGLEVQANLDQILGKASLTEAN